LTLKNAKAKGSRAERRAIGILERAGYLCLKAGASIGPFDIIALGAQDIRCIQVKAGTRYASGVEREQMTLVVLPTNCAREIWRFPDRCKAPLIERL
jgi:Holliday junction resolvase